MVSSVDGIIAKKDNSVSWFDITDYYDNGLTVKDPQAVLDTIDCYIMGSHTYELAMELSKSYGWPYGDKPTIVLTTRNFPNERRNVEFYSGNLTALVTESLMPKYENVWVLGGAALTRDFIREKLADEIIVSILPIILGDGLPFFNHIGMEQPLHLKNTTAYKTGMVELCYEIKK